MKNFITKHKVFVAIMCIVGFGLGLGVAFSNIYTTTPLLNSFFLEVALGIAIVGGVYLAATFVRPTVTQVSADDWNREPKASVTVPAVVATPSAPVTPTVIYIKQQGGFLKTVGAVIGVMLLMGVGMVGVWFALLFLMPH